MNTRSIVALALVALFPATCACGSSSPTPASTNTDTVTFTMVYADVLSPSCTPCHTPGGGTGDTLGGLDLSTQALAYTNLQKSPAGAGCKGMGLTLVVPGDAATSLLVEKVQSAAPPCGSQMPFGCGAGAVTCLSAAQVQEIADWINGGAKND
jgi:hypothetical protein